MTWRKKLGWCIPVVAVLLLAACQVGGKSAAEKRHGLQVACLASGRVWYTASNTCDYPPEPMPELTATPTPQPTATPTPQPTATPTPRPLTDEELKLRASRQIWLFAYAEWLRLAGERAQAENTLRDRVEDPSELLDEHQDLIKAYRDGPYRFVLEGNFPRFSEVRKINDRIRALVEAQLKEQELYVSHLEEDQSQSRKDQLYAESETLRKQNNIAGQAISSTAQDLVNIWIADPRIAITPRV